MNSPKFNQDSYNINRIDRDLDENVIRFIYNKDNYELNLNINILYLSEYCKKFKRYFMINLNDSKNMFMILKIKDFVKNIILFLLDFVSNEKIKIFY